jgi:SAM-dependent methyltransferase
MITTTPARARFPVSPDGLIRVGATALTYADGSEQRVLDILRSCTDLSSTSVEMLNKATDWAERYHTHPARGNVIRALDIPADAVVLEIGSGCGGVTRYLGEAAATVDALEPMVARAQVARERTRDLPGVAVLLGEVSDLPEEPTYDVVVVVGVLEYVGHGTRDSAPYLAFLADIHARLKPGGSLVLAIENKLGVKYFVGAPEDHTTQIFDSIEGYPRGEGARTFSRIELLELLAEAGLQGRALAAFPDYKLTRTVLAPEQLPRDARSLLHRIPDFPSPDWTIPRPKLASERSVWREFVAAELAAEAPNSFVFVAGKDGASPLWPDQQAAVFYDVDFAQQHSLETVVSVSAGSVSFSRSLISPDAAAVSTDSVASATDNTSDVQVDAAGAFGSYSFIPGLDLPEALGYGSAEERSRLMRAWADLVERSGTEDGYPLDLTVIVRPDGSLAATPVTLRAPALSLDQVLARGVMRLGIAAANAAPASRWPGALTVDHVVGHLGSFIPALQGDWLAAAVELNAHLSATLSTRYTASTTVDATRDELAAVLALPLSSLELGELVFQRERRLDTELSELQNAYRQSQNLLAEAQREVERLRALPNQK